MSFRTSIAVVAGLTLAACLFSLGITLFLWDFIRYGLPKDDQIARSEAPLPAVAPSVAK